MLCFPEAHNLFMNVMIQPQMAEKAGAGHDEADLVNTKVYEKPSNIV